MIFTTKAEYGVPLLVELGRHHEDGVARLLKAIAEAVGLPLAYLERIVALLKKAALVESTPRPAALPERAVDREPPIPGRDQRPDLSRDLRNRARRALTPNRKCRRHPPTVANIRSYGNRPGRRTDRTDYWTGEGLYSRPRASKDQPASSP